MKNTMNIFRNLVLVMTFTLAALFSPEKANAQVHLGITGGSINLSDTIREYDTVMVSFVVKNYGTAPFNGNFLLEAYLEDSILQALIPYDSLSIPNLWLGPGDTLPLILPWVVHTTTTQPAGPLRIGNNLIVVWPSAVNMNNVLVDTVFENVFITDTLTSIEPTPRLDEPNVYFVFNTQYQLLQMMPGPDLVNIATIEIRDIAGRLIYRKAGHPGYIDVDSWEHGIYIVALQFGNGSRRSYKIVKVN